MASTPEGKLTSRIQAEIRREYGEEVWLMKVHGHIFQAAGVPDLIGCLRGHFFALEVKHPDTGHDATPLQRKTLEMIEKAGGIAAVVTSPDEALSVLTLETP